MSDNGRFELPAQFDGIAVTVSRGAIVCCHRAKRFCDLFTPAEERRGRARVTSSEIPSVGLVAKRVVWGLR
jgi:hypothetical protein